MGMILAGHLSLSSEFIGPNKSYTLVGKRTTASDSDLKVAAPPPKETSNTAEEILGQIWAQTCCPIMGHS